MTPARASATRALTGAWFGLLIALLISLLTFGPAWLGLLLGGLLIGALSGAMLGYLARRIGSGQHDHASPQTLGASRHEAMVTRRVRRPHKTAAPPELHKETNVCSRHSLTPPQRATLAADTRPRFAHATNPGARDGPR